MADYHEREEEVERLARDSKERVEDALSERDQALARENLLQKEVDRLTDERRISAVKRQEEIDSALEVIRQRANSQKKGAEEDLKTLALKNADLLVDAEKALREAKSYREQLERMHRIREEERKGVDQHVQDLDEKVAKTTASYEEEKCRREEVQDINKGACLSLPPPLIHTHTYTHTYRRTHTLLLRLSPSSSHTHSSCTPPDAIALPPSHVHRPACHTPLSHTLIHSLTPCHTQTCASYIPSL